MNTSKVKRWAGNLLLILGGLLAGTLLLEIGLRVAGVSYPNFYQVDVHRGLAPRPGAEGWNRREGEAYVSINSAGFRDREYTREKAENTLRIAVLGDSYAEAIQVPLENTFWAAMESEIAGCRALGERNIEVINFGVSGYGTAQELLTLRHYVWDYSPDIVVVAFVTGNDIRDNLHALSQTDYVPYFVYRNGELILDSGFLQSDEYRLRQSWIPQLLEYSRVLQLLNEARYGIRTQLRQWNAEVELRAAAGDLDAEELGISSGIYLEPNDPIWTEAWQITEGILALMKDEVAQQGADLLVVTLSNGIQVHPNIAIRETFRESLGVRNLFYSDLRIKTLGNQDGFFVLNLAQPFQAYAEEHQIFLHGFENTALGKGHWNAEGHRLAGQMISQKICEEFLPGPPSQHKPSTVG